MNKHEPCIQKRPGIKLAFCAETPGKKKTYFQAVPFIQTREVYGKKSRDKEVRSMKEKKPAVPSSCS